MDEDIYKDEVWRDIEGYEGLYQVSNRGRVKSLDRVAHDNRDVKRNIKGKLKKQIYNRTYPYVVLYVNNVSNLHDVHRLVAKAFIYNENCLPVVNHKNGFPMDNRVENLEWVSYVDNAKHAVEMGLTSRGSSHYRAVLNDKIVLSMKEMYSTNKFTLGKLSKIFNVHKAHLSGIFNGRIWGHVKLNGSAIVKSTVICKKGRPKTNEQDVLKIRELYDSGGVGISSLSMQFKLSPHTIEKIVYRYTWKNVA